MTNLVTTNDIKVKVDENVQKCNACYVHGFNFLPFTAIINNPAKILVVTDWPGESMTCSEDYIKTKEYHELTQYFGESWLTRPGTPFSHTFAIKCHKRFFDGSRAIPVTRCKTHTSDYAIGLGFTGIIAVGKESHVQTRVVQVNEITKTGGGRLVLAVEKPSLSSLLQVNASVESINKFRTELLSS